jgi:chromatin remodeling complex protein RSC6
MAKKTATPATTPVETVTETPVETPVEVPVSPEVQVSDRFDALAQKLVAMATLVRDLQAELKTSQKELTKLVKSRGKKTRRTPTAGGAKRTPSGFAKPVKLSDALCDFLGVDHGTELARTEVTRRINTYIKEHSLQDSADKRKIHPDTKLSKVLIGKDGEVLNYFTLQAQLKHNFVKA